MMKKYLTKAIALATVTISIIAFNPTGASAAWKQNNNGWWYTEGSSWATGWKLIDGNWYYFYSDGYMAKDTTIDGYYLNLNGAWSQTSYENMTSEKALEILKNAYPDYIYIGGGELNEYPFYPHSGESAYRFTFKNGNDIYIGWVLMDGEYAFRFNNSI